MAMLFGSASVWMWGMMLSLSDVREGDEVVTERVTNEWVRGASSIRMCNFVQTNYLQWAQALQTTIVALSQAGGGSEWALWR